MNASAVSLLKQGLFLLLAIAGAGFTWYHNLLFTEQYGTFTVSQFIADSYINHASSSISNDVTVAALTFWAWSFFDVPQSGFRRWIMWPILLFLTMMIAFAFAFPFYLFLRERKLNAPKS